LATAVFSCNRFYRRALGFDTAAFAAYWDEFFTWVIKEDSVRVVAASAAGRILAVLVAADSRFPTWISGLRFVIRLARRIGPVRIWAYLQFAAAYQRFMHQPAAEQRREVRGLWLMASPGAYPVSLGRQLVRHTMQEESQGRPVVFTGMIDGRDARLAHFYQRLGFDVGPAMPFRGRLAARIELRRQQCRGGVACRG
jgi:hypothetical protein